MCYGKIKPGDAGLYLVEYCDADSISFPPQLRERHQEAGGSFIGKTVKAPGIDVYKLTKDGKETWIEVWTEESGNYNYVVTR